MLLRALIVIALVITGQPAYAANPLAVFSIDDDQRPMQSVVATVEDHPMAASTHHWLILNFYAFTPTAEELAKAAQGDLKPIESRIHEGDNYNHSFAKLVLSVDKVTQDITQVDISLPGYSCTIAFMPEQLKTFSSEYSLKDNQITLKTSGTHECNLNKKVKFGWKIDVTGTAYPLAKQS